jgi:1,4-alpha-glucan branching enzyme
MQQKFRIYLSSIVFVFIYSSCLSSQEITSVKHPDWSYNKTIYEVNIRQFSEEGTIKAFEEHIPRLKEMGVGIIWLMPVHPIGEKNRKGTLGSYYSVKNYLEIDPAYGTPEDFKSLVSKVHESGMYIIIDWVANHTAWDNVWVTEHPEFYTKDSLGNFVPPVADWSDVIDLDYDNKELRTYMLDAMKYWVEEYNIDGYRCDVAAMVPLDFWLKVRKELDKIKPVFMLAEAWEPELHQAFDMTYSWDIYHITNDIAQGKKNAEDLKVRFEKEDSMYTKKDFRMQFISNHDENSWNGTVFERLGDAAETFAVFISVIPGMPLIYNGQEIGLNKKLQFFEKDPIDWSMRSKNGNKFDKIYTTLFKLKESNHALWNGEMGGEFKIIPSSYDDMVFAFAREKENDKVVAVFNLSSKEISVQLNSPDLAGSYTNLFTNEKISLLSIENLNLKSWEYRIYISQNTD